MSEDQAPAAIREAGPGDVAAIASIYAPYVHDSAISFELASPDAGNIAARIARAADAYPWLVCERVGEVIGYAYASEHRSRAAYRWTVEVSVYVRRDAQRGHVARGLYEALFELLKLQHRCLALAGITMPNPASVGFHEALGFQRCAMYPNTGHKHGAWHDVGWWQRPLGELPEMPTEPERLTGLRDTPEFAAALRQGEAALRH
jgi:phosphinothricin acetyltransferase